MSAESHRAALFFTHFGNPLRLADNGSGLTEQEILSYLTVIGRGSTRELRDCPEAADPGASRVLIRQFGIAFLSAFLIALDVIVETHPAGSPPLRWTSAGHQQPETWVEKPVLPGIGYIVIPNASRLGERCSVAIRGPV